MGSVNLLDSVRMCDSVRLLYMLHPTNVMKMLNGFGVIERINWVGETPIVLPKPLPSLHILHMPLIFRFVLH